MKRLSSHSSLPSRRVIRKPNKHIKYPHRYTQSDELALQGYTLIDIEKAKIKAFVAKNLWELQMWEQIERGEI